MFQTLKRFLSRCNQNVIPLVIILPFIYIIGIECLHRRSFIGGFQFIFESPIAYIANVLLLMSILSVCLVFRERLFWITLISLICFLLALTNFLILGNRVSPLSFNDIKVFSSVASIARQYFGIREAILACTAIILCIIFIIYLRIRIPKIDRRRHIVRDSICLVIFISFGLVSAFIGKSCFKNTGNITLTYLNNGFLYCFSNSIVDVGIPKPVSYSKSAIKEIDERLDNFNAAKNRETGKKPNIIFVQLESFFDVSNMRYYTYSEDPMPTFHQLIKDYSSGLLTVPAFGAGTVNTEFEILTGMDVDYFGLCEYPYKTILKKQTCESMAYNLQEVGYKTAVIHNNRGTFYSRNQVFKHLGFDMFDSAEFMNDYETNAIDWIKDKVLPDEIIKRMKSTPETDFIYTITVQSHGKYPTENPETPYAIKLNGENDPELANAFEYYINECHDVDDFIADLIQKVSKFEEDTIIVFYGDHLPTLDITNHKLQYQNTYQTSYVIWDNIGLPVKDKNLRAFQLSSYIMGKLGYKNGVLTRFHQMYSDDPDYAKKLNLLQYDMLYGSKYIYKGGDPYSPSDLQLGIYPIALRHVAQDYENPKEIIVRGAHFTTSSCVFINGKKYETKYINRYTLRAFDHELEDGDRVRVRQLTSTGGKIGSTAELIYTSGDEEEFDANMHNED